MKHFRRTLAVLLVLCVLFTIAVPAFAARKKNEYKQYNTYLCLGDSIAAGSCLSRNHQETVLLTSKDFDTLEEYQQYVADMLAPDYEEIYRGYKPEIVPTAYHSIVADKLGVDTLIPGGRSGMRAYEFRYMLTGEYTEPDQTYAWGNSYFDENNDGVFDSRDLDLINKLYNYEENIKKADLISINLGSSDVLSPSFSAAFAKLGEDSSNPEVQEAKKILETTGNLGIAFSKLLSGYMTMGKLTTVIETLNKEFDKNLDLFKDNYGTILRKIYKLNPNATIVGISTYNFFEDFHISENDGINISLLTAPYVNYVNEYIKSFGSKYSGTYYYANVMGTETYQTIYSDPDWYDLYIYKVHPTLAGHQHIADRVVACLPTQADSDGSFFSNFTAWFKRLIHFTDIIDILFSWLPSLLN